MSSSAQTTIVRGRFLDIQSLVQQAQQIPEQVRYLEDGVLISENGKIKWFGTWQDAQPHLPENIEIQHYPEQLIVPGFIDTHIHYPQTEMVGAYGEQLLSWLNTYTFPTELQFKDPAYAKHCPVFVQELLKMVQPQHGILYGPS
jgi:guanine deaminase